MGEQQEIGVSKPITIRLDEATRAQLDIIAQLNDRTVTDEIRSALRHWIARTKDDPTVQARAEQIRAEIEREAKTKRDAIAAIFEAPGSTPGATSPSGRPVAKTARARQ